MIKFDGKEKRKMEQQNEKTITSMKQNFFGVISAFSILLTMVVSGYIIFFCRNITTSGNAEFTETVPSTAFAIAVIALLILDYMLISAYIRYHYNRPSKSGMVNRHYIHPH